VGILGFNVSFIKLKLNLSWTSSINYCRLLLCQYYGLIAQSVEQRTENPCVAGSIPAQATTLLPLPFMQHLDFVVPAEFHNNRIDKALSSLSGMSRSRLQDLINQGHVKLNDGIVASCNLKVKAEDALKVSVPEPKPTDIVPRSIDFEIVYEDEDLMVINKPAGLTVHPGAGNHQDTLVNGLIEYCGSNLSGVGGVLRPGIVHRLDKDTSGLMVVAKNDLSHLALSKQIGDKTARRVYWAVIWGVPVKTSDIIENYIGRSKTNRTQMKVLKQGKFASTSYKVLKVLGKNLASVVECSLNTGRTHQIRVHMSYIGHSIIGDQVYGHNARKIKHNLSATQQDYVSGFNRQALHSHQLSFIHPRTEGLMQFEAPVPEDMQLLIKSLEL